MKIENTKEMMFSIIDRITEALRQVLFENNRSPAEKAYFYIFTMCLGIFSYKQFTRIWGKGLYIGIVGWDISEKSAFLLYCLLLIVNMILETTVKKKGMNIGTMIKCALFPTIVYLFLMHLEYCETVSIVLLIGLVLYLVCQIVSMIHRYKRMLERKRKFSPKKCMSYIVACGSEVLNVFIICGLLCDIGVWMWNVRQEDSTALKGYSNIVVVNSEDDLWGCNREGLLYLKEETFASMTEQEQVNALQFLVDMEMTYLGCEPVQLEVGKFENEGVLGSYDNERRIIKLNINLLEEGVYECIPILLHESFHAYEHACVESVKLEAVNTDLKVYETISTWKEEIDNYSK